MITSKQAREMAFTPTLYKTKEVVIALRELADQQTDLLDVLIRWTHDRHLESYEDRKRFRKEARALLAQHQAAAINPGD